MRSLQDTSPIETPEQIEIHLPLAGVGTRSLAYLVDFLWQCIPILVAAVLLFLTLPFQAADFFREGPAGLNRLSLIALAVLSGVVFATNFLYFAFFEAFWHGQSPGKRVFHLRVVRDGGYPIDGRAALVRNLLRTVDILPGLYLVGILSIFIGRHGKRIGDYAAGTIVVTEHRPASVASVSAAFASPNSAPTREAALVSEFLVRRDGLVPDARANIARQLANKLAIRQQKAMPDDPEQFLEDFLKHGNR